MTYNEILRRASEHLHSLSGNSMDILTIAKPSTIDYADHLAKTISKLSPLVGNMIEFKVCEELNKLDWNLLGYWERQDPGFPDTIFKGDVFPAPGIEIKTWFPLATEITARFKDSINHFSDDQINVAVVAWLPEFIIYGKPKILDIWIGSAKSLAEARDKHYHNPPDYLVFEPEDTTSRTVNLQQTNTNGYKFQGFKDLLEEASKELEYWDNNFQTYRSDSDYQAKMRTLLGKYPYRLDTNFAKIDRIKHSDLELFKSKILNSVIHGHSLRTWSKLLSDTNVDTINLIKDLI